jgi:hypothetical protein
MAISQTSSVDQITIESNGIIILRTNNVITDGTTQLGQTYSRNSLYPGQDLTGQPQNIVSIANLVWTSEVISSYQNSLKSNITPISQG